MRVFRTLLLSTVVAVGLAGPVAAQTPTTTMPPVRSIPVTPAPTPTTVAPAPSAVRAPAAASAQAAAPGMADTGLAADKLVPFGFVLIGLGAALTGGSRRLGRPRYSFL